MKRSNREKWTNPSVLAFAGGADPVSAVSERARQIVTQAMDKGWTGPPFDPIHLADILGLATVPREDVIDARTVPDDEGRPRIEYNPTRPRGRVKYSIAHEIAHTLFADWSETVRHRRSHKELTGDDWQLEALCNVAAAEFVMPIGSFRGLMADPLTIDQVIAEQRRYDLSMEAVLIRAMHLRTNECAMFCASRIPDGPAGGRYRVDYLIGSRAWQDGSFRGQVLSKNSCVGQCTAVGYTSKGIESWTRGQQLRVECVGIPPYPGSKVPRVVGLLTVPDSAAVEALSIEYLVGDATSPTGEGPKVIVQVVNDSAITWGGGGFAAAIRRTWPKAQEAFREWVGPKRENLRLGAVHFVEVAEGLQIASIVAQHGYGPSLHPRIRYGALHEGLLTVASVAQAASATAHMPRIGAGMAGGHWSVVEELIQSTLGAAGVPVVVYDQPGSHASQFAPYSGQLLL